MRLELLILGLCVLTAGCNADPRCRRETALLRAEIIDLEDQYYALKSKYEAADSELSASRRGSGTVTGSEVIYEGDVFYENGDASSTIYLESQPGEYAPREYIDPGFDLNGPVEGQTFEVDPNGLETVYPVGEDLPPNYPSTSSNRARNRSGGRPGNTNSDATLLNGPTISRVSSANSPVTEIAIHRAFTRGQDVDGQPGDDGLRLLIQPRNARGDVLLRPGELTVSLIDPQATGKQQRVGLWTFLPSETALFMADENASARGILLHLPWEQTPPQGGELVVFVRFKTADGRRLEASAPVRILPPAGGYSPNEPLIAEWSMGGGPENLTAAEAAELKNGSGILSRRSIPAMPASTESSRLQKPSWRPIR